jgi:hypothetical protein
VDIVPTIRSHIWCGRESGGTVAPISPLRQKPGGGRRKSPLETLLSEFSVAVRSCSVTSASSILPQLSQLYQISFQAPGSQIRLQDSGNSSENINTAFALLR